MLKTLDRILGGGGREGDLDRMIELCDAQGAMPGKTICGLADGTAWATRGFINKYRAEFEAKITAREMVAV